MKFSAEDFKEIRGLLGLSQKNMAPLLQVSREWVIKLEGGSEPPSDKVSELMIHLLNSRDELQGYKSAVPKETIQRGFSLSQEEVKDKYILLLEKQESRQILLDEAAKAAIQAVRETLDLIATLKDEMQETKKIVRGHEDRIAEIEVHQMGMLRWGIEQFANLAGRPFQDVQKEVAEVVTAVRTNRQRKADNHKTDHNSDNSSHS